MYLKLKTVNKKRIYRSPRREQQAVQTRIAVLEAAHVQFISVGWQKTTIASIAKTASVSKELIYAGFGNKQSILQQVVTSALRGPEADLPLLEQTGPRAIQAERDPKKIINMFAHDMAERLARVAPVLSVVREAGCVEGELAKMYLALHAGRRRNLGFVADTLNERGALAENVSREEALSHIWRLASPELFTLMTNVEGVTFQDYANWLSNSLEALLLRR